MSLSNWIKWSKADYYVLFLKAWIPFNAWYHKTYYDETSCKTDKDMIIKVKTMDNPYKQKLKNLLTATGDEADVFRFHLAHLYHELELHTVPNANERYANLHTHITKCPTTALSDAMKSIISTNWMLKREYIVCQKKAI